MRHLAYIIACFVLLINIQLVNAQGDVKIGTQVWTSKNLDVSTFRNGDVIPEAKSRDEWVKASENKKAAFCYWVFDPKYGEKYGKLYNWYAVKDPRGLAPKDYHVPSDAEWTILSDFLGGKEIAGKKMKSKDGWESYEEGGSKTCPNCADWTDSYKKQVPCHTCENARYVKTPSLALSGNGDNSSGFSGLPGGSCDYFGTFFFFGTEGDWWSSSENDSTYAWNRSLYYTNNYIYRHRIDKKEGCSVRCLKD